MFRRDLGNPPPPRLDRDRGRTVEPWHQPAAPKPIGPVLGCLLAVVALFALSLMALAVWVTVSGSDLGFVR